MANITEVQDSLRQLFLETGIKRVVFIDDEFKLDFAQVSGVFSTADIKELRKIEALDSIDITDDREVNAANLRKLWDTLEDSQRYGLFSSLPNVAGEPERAKIEEKSPDTSLLDRVVIPVLHDIFGGLPDIDFKELSFSEWKNKVSRLLDEAKTIKTIFLFDQDLSKDGGSDKEGIRQIQDTLKKAETQNSQVICGLLSHTFTPEEAYDKWKKFAKQNNIEESKFILVAKSEIEDPPSFVHMAKLMILNDPCGALIRSVSKAIEDSHLEAKRKIEDINIFDFDHIVFRSSHHEGIWEVDTLIRLFSVFHRDIIRGKVRTNGEINDLLNKIRKISNIKSNPSALYCGKSWEIQQSELYETGDHINKLHLPLELGDVFQSSTGTKKYILIAQPCDLMVRLGGETPGRRRPSVNVAILADIVLDKSSNPHYCFELPLFQEKESWYIRFTSTHMIDLLVLDMCVFQEDGASKFDVDQQCPNNVIPAWQLHHEIARKDVTENINRYLKLKEKIDIRQIIDLLFKSSNDHIFKANVDDSVKGKETLNYSCKRVGRLCEPRASAMLTAYANYVCRAAFEHDFGKLDETSKGL